jgi:hypothetical protein
MIVDEALKSLKGRVDLRQTDIKRTIIVKNKLVNFVV